MGKPFELARDWWLPVGLAVLGVAEVVDAYAAEEPARRVAMVAVLVPMSLVLGLRRRHPAAVVVAASLLTLVLVLAVQADLAAQPPLTPFLVLVAALFALGVHADRRTFTTGAAAGAALLGGLEVTQLAAGRDPGDVVPSVLFWVAAAVVGRLVHLSRSEAETARDRARRAEDERDLAVAAERSRIARELHDVVAHSLSVIVIQASVEARTLGDRDDSTARTLRSVERTGREALVELRRLLGLLRADGDGVVPLQPLPSLASVAEDGGMLDDVRRAGHPVRLEVRGEPRDLPAGVELSAYRIVQEALTNVVRHAPGSPVRVVVDHEHDDVRVEVHNGAGRPGSGVDLGSGGHGLSGMRERVRVYDGDLDAGPDGNGGWVVRARFPVAVERV